MSQSCTLSKINKGNSIDVATFIFSVWWIGKYVYKIRKYDKSIK